MPTTTAPRVRPRPDDLGEHPGHLAAGDEQVVRPLEDGLDAGRLLERVAARRERDRPGEQVELARPDRGREQDRAEHGAPLGGATQRRPRRPARRVCSFGDDDVALAGLPRRPAARRGRPGTGSSSRPSRARRRYRESVGLRPALACSPESRPGGSPSASWRPLHQAATIGPRKGRVFEKVLIANRGEIAVRVIRTCRELGIATVAVYSELDATRCTSGSPTRPTRSAATTAAESYLNIEAILDAIAALAAPTPSIPATASSPRTPPSPGPSPSAGVTFIGPPPEAIELWATRSAPASRPSRAGVAGVPGRNEPVNDPAEIVAFGEEHGWPVAIKASYGGGGRGMKVVDGADEARRGARRRRSARRAACFGRDEVYLERYLAWPRHIEMQVVADRSRQRRLARRAGLLVPAPPPEADRGDPGAGLPGRGPPGRWARPRSASARPAATRAPAPSSSSTRTASFYFLEMNTRLQVEHPVTELVTGLDLVELQLRVAAGEPLGFTQDEIAARRHGHAIECRVNAEDPAGGRSCRARARSRRSASPGASASAVDAGYESGDDGQPVLRQPRREDRSSGATDREAARRRMLRALDETVVEGVATTIPALDAILSHRRLRRRHATRPASSRSGSTSSERRAAPAAPAASTAPRRACSREVDAEVDGRRYPVKLWLPDAAPAAGAAPASAAAAGGRPTPAAAACRRRDGTVTVPMQGTIVKVLVADGDHRRGRSTSLRARGDEDGEPDHGRSRRDRHRAAGGRRRRARRRRRRRASSNDRPGAAPEPRRPPRSAVVGGRATARRALAAGSTATRSSPSRRCRPPPGAPSCSTRGGFSVERRRRRADDGVRRRRSGSGRSTIAICCEYDALPDIGHACGHNVIAAAARRRGARARPARRRPRHHRQGARHPGRGGRRRQDPDARARRLRRPPRGDDGPPLAERADQMPCLAVAHFDVRYTGQGRARLGLPRAAASTPPTPITIAQVAIGLLRQHADPATRCTASSPTAAPPRTSSPRSPRPSYYVRARSLERSRSWEPRVHALLRGRARSPPARRSRCCSRAGRTRSSAPTRRWPACYRRNAEELGRALRADRRTARSTGSTDMANVSLAIPSIHPTLGIDSLPAVNHQAEFAAALRCARRRQGRCSTAPSPWRMTVIDLAHRRHAARAPPRRRPTATSPDSLTGRPPPPRCPVAGPRSGPGLSGSAGRRRRPRAGRRRPRPSVAMRCSASRMGTRRFCVPRAAAADVGERGVHAGLVALGPHRAGCARSGPAAARGRSGTPPASPAPPRRSGSRRPRSSPPSSTALAYS